MECLTELKADPGQSAQSHTSSDMVVHRLQGYIQSIYLVAYPHGLLLLDGCSRADIKMLVHFVQYELHRPITDLKVIVVTHMHPDHAGAAVKLRKLSGCAIVSANREKPWYHGLDGVAMHLTDMALTAWVARRTGKPLKNLWYPARLAADYRLDDGEQVPHFPDWYILETPGHTDRDLSVWHHPSRQIYVADLMVLVKRRFIPPFPVFHPNKYRASVKRVAALEPAAIWLAHGGEVHLLAADFQRLLEKAPVRPMTHWGATKSKLKKILRLRG